MATQIQVKKAVKYEAKGRVALIGPAGSGKSWTSLVLARLLAGEHGKILAIDTEHGSLSKYADLFDFDVIEPDSYDVNLWLEYLAYAEKNDYSVFLTDSLSHYWMGKDGALEFVDMASRRSGKGDTFSGWKEFRPHERAMVDRLIASPCHTVCTMRTKTEYVEEINERGKKVRRKVGLAPIQRDGLEYEFDLVAYMDDENNFITDKTRCPFYSKKAIPTPKAKDFQPLADWLKGAERTEPVVLPIESRPIDTGGYPEGTKEARQAVMERRLTEVKAPLAVVGPDPDLPEAVAEIFAFMGNSKSRIIEKINELFFLMVDRIGPDDADEFSNKYLAKFGIKNTTELRVSQARELAYEMWKRVHAPETVSA